MERFFIITEKSSLHSEYMKYKQNIHDINELVKVLCKDEGITSTEYSAWSDSLYIVPKNNDCEKFDKSLCSSTSNGLRRFKLWYNFTLDHRVAAVVDYLTEMV